MTMLAAVLVALRPRTAAADRVAVAALLALVVGVALPLARAARPRRPRQLPVAADPDRLLHRHLALDPGRPDRPRHRRQDRGGRPDPRRSSSWPRKVGSIHWPSLALGVGACSRVLQGVAAARLPVPGPRGRRRARHRCCRRLFDFRGLGIAVVGDIPSRLPALALPVARRACRSTPVAARGRGDLPGQLRRPASSPPAASARGGYRGRRRPRADRLRRGQHRRRAASAPSRSPPRTRARRSTPTVGGQIAARGHRGRGGADGDAALPAAGARASCRSRRSARSWSPPALSLIDVARPARDLADQPDGVRLRADRAWRGRSASAS